MLLLTLRGTPTLYYGEEIGMTDVEIPPHRQQDPWVLETAKTGRDPCRTPMQWNAGPNAGFAPPHVEELWLPLADDYESVNVAAQLDEPRSMLQLYRRLLDYRRSKPSLRRGIYRPVEGVPSACFVYIRSDPVDQPASDDPVLVGLNFSDAEQRVHLPAVGRGTVVISTLLDRQERVDLGDLRLRPHEGVIIELADH
jgi:alpha-glucosidase